VRLASPTNSSRALATEQQQETRIGQSFSRTATATDPNRIVAGGQQQPTSASEFLPSRAAIAEASDRQVSED